MGDVEFSASSWQEARKATELVSGRLMPALERATSGTPLGAVSESPVDRATFDGLYRHTDNFFKVQELIRLRLGNEALKMDMTGQDYHATEEAASEAAEVIW